MEIRGKYVLLGMAIVIACAVGYSTWHQVQRTTRTRALWGYATADRILNAPLTELLVLDRDTDGALPADTLTVGDQVWHVSRRKDITFVEAQPSGILRLREWLILDEAFDWDAMPKPLDATSEPPVAFSFHGPDGNVLIVLDLARGQATLWPKGPTAVLAPIYVTAFREFVAKQLKPPAPAGAQSATK